jgi:prolyl-tRNA editing enzyme YbaK/EbsC (Cys-tRNA(Pro) deacylase)
MPISCAKQSFAIGGVPPVGHARPPIVLIDETLLRFDNIWVCRQYAKRCPSA